MDIASRKLELIEKLMGIINPNTIDKIEKFFKSEIEEYSNNEFPEIVNELLNQSEQDSLDGKVISHEIVINEAKEKYKLL